MERETCETSGDMEANLPSRRVFPYANWGAKVALLGVLLALLAGLLLGVLVLAVPAALIGLRAYEANHELTTWANVAVQLATEAGFLIVPIAIAARGGAFSAGKVLERLGVRRFQPSALKWMAAAVGFYLFCSYVYQALLGPPHQENIAKMFGVPAVQVLLIVLAAPICEEVCFRGMLFGGLRVRLPRFAAALISGAIFGILHATTGIGAVPLLILLGFILALLYEKTGSIIPGVLLHMLNNSAALLAR
jgi:membrane protease YdiL (CAAX protease family)